MAFWIVLNTSPTGVGAIERIVLNHPSQNKADVIAWVRQQNILTKGIKYTIQGPLPVTDPNPMVLATQRNLLNLSSEAVAAALHNPRGQAGMNRPDAPPDQLGFQRLGDGALPVDAEDNVFGDVNDGTVSDITQDGRELHRPDFGQNLNG